MKKKMAFIYMSNYHDWPMGGMLTYVINILPQLCEIYDVDIYGCSVNGSIPRNLIINNKEYKINVYTNVNTVNKKIPNFVRSFFDLSIKGKFLKKYDVVYSHTSATTNAAFFRSKHFLLVHHQHGLSYKKANLYNRFLGIGYTIAQLLADVSFFVASENEVNFHNSSIGKWSKGNFYQIGSPINVDEFEYKNSNRENKFIYTGRIDEHKNILLLIESFDLFLSKSNTDDKLLIIGDGPEYKSAIEKIKELNREKQILMLGRKSHEEILRYLSNCIAFLFPSKGEGMSLSVLEALAAGLPVGGFDVYGMGNLISNEFNGFLTKKQDKETFAETILYLKNNHELLRENCKLSIVQYSSKNIAKYLSEKIELNFKK